MAAVTQEEAQELISAADCLGCYVPRGMEKHIIIALLAAQIDPVPTAQELMLAASCFMSCIPAGAEDAIILYLLCQFDPDSTDCDPETLIEESDCLICMTPPGMDSLVMAASLQQNLEDTQTAQELVTAAECYFHCIPQGGANAAIIYLFCELLPE